MLDAHDLANAFCGGFGGESFGLRSDDDSRGFRAGLRDENVGRRDGFKADAANSAVAIFKNYVDAAHMTRTSNFNFSTRVAAASFGEPEMI